jgi:hypothetical protein
MNKKTLTLALTALSVWLFAGCFQTETTTTIDSKGGMDRKVDIAIAEASKDQLKSKKEAFEKDGWTTGEETKDGKYHLTASKKWADAKEFADPFGDTKVSVELKEKKVFFTEVFDAKKSAGITDTNRTAWAELKYTFHVTMPSKVENSNADKTEGSKATWEFDYNEVFDQGTFTMTAEASEGGGMCGSTMFVTGLGLGLFLLAIKLLFSFAMANRRRAKAVMQN